MESQKKNNISNVYNYLYNISTIYIILQLITIILKRPLFGTPTNAFDIYFLGGDNRSAFILIPLCGILFANDYKNYNKIRIKSWIIALCGWACLIIPFAVTGMVAYGIFIFLTLFMNSKIIKKCITPRNVVIIVVIFVIGVIFFDIQKYLAPITEALGKGDSISLLGYRDIIWKDAFKVFQNNWLIGIGDLTDTQVGNYILGGAEHAHNIIMEYLMNTGILGTSLLFMWIYKILSIKTKKKSKQMKVLINCLIAFIFCSVFDFYIGLAYFYLLISLIYIVENEDNKEKVEYEKDMYTVC